MGGGKQEAQMADDRLWTMLLWMYYLVDLVARSTLEYYCTTTLDMVRLGSWWSRVLLYHGFGRRGSRGT